MSYETCVMLVLLPSLWKDGGTFHADYEQDDAGLGLYTLTNNGVAGNLVLQHSRPMEDGLIVVSEVALLENADYQFPSVAASPITKEVRVIYTLGEDVWMVSSMDRGVTFSHPVLVGAFVAGVGPEQESTDGATFASILIGPHITWVTTEYVSHPEDCSIDLIAGSLQLVFPDAGDFFRLAPEEPYSLLELDSLFASPDLLESVFDHS